MQVFIKTLVGKTFELEVRPRSGLLHLGAFRSSRRGSHTLQQLLTQLLLGSPMSLPAAQLTPNLRARPLPSLLHADLTPRNTYIRQNPD